MTQPPTEPANTDTPTAVGNPPNRRRPVDRPQPSPHIPERFSDEQEREWIGKILGCQATTVHQSLVALEVPEQLRHCFIRLWHSVKSSPQWYQRFLDEADEADEPA